MTIIEKYIREKLGRADAPPEVDANDLWAGIESQLLPEEKLPSATTTFPWKGMVLGLLLLMVGGLAWLLYPAPPPETVLAEGVFTSTATAEHKTSTSQSATAASAPTKSKIAQATDTKASLSASTSPDAPPLSTAKKNNPFHNDGTDKSTLAVEASRSQVIDQTQSLSSPKSGTKSLTRETLPKANSQTEDNATIKHGPITLEDTVFEDPSTAPAAAPSPEASVPAVQSTSATKTENVPLSDLATARALQKEEKSTIEERSEELAKGNTRKIAEDKSNLTGNQIASSIPQTEKAPVAEESSAEPTKDDAEAGLEDKGATFQSSQGARLSIGLQTGTNLLLRNYASGGEGPGEALNTAVTVAAGASFGLDLKYRITNKLSISTGLEYHRTLNPFDHATVNDTMIAHPSPFNSGLINAIAKRRTTHNHRLSFLTVPLLINHTWTFGNFDFGVGAGVGLNFRQSATGKTLDSDGLVIAYDAASGAADVSEFFLSYRLQPVLSWQPKPGSKLRLAFTGGIGYQTFGVSPLSLVKQHALLLNGSVGLRYGF